MFVEGKAHEISSSCMDCKVSEVGDKPFVSVRDVAFSYPPMGMPIEMPMGNLCGGMCGSALDADLHDDEVSTTMDCLRADRSILDAADACSTKLGGVTGSAISSVSTAHAY
jgi:hypothetical protein